MERQPELEQVQRLTVKTLDQVSITRTLDGLLFADLHTPIIPQILSADKRRFAKNAVRLQPGHIADAIRLFRLLASLIPPAEKRICSSRLQDR
ncbi:MAG: hypothetical protein NT169_28570 [Chloroflexi bacterium]|nr:hypothetical protein [Chloroflexota bacterium]